MREISHLDFDLEVERPGPGTYGVRVMDAPAGETAPVPFAIPFSDLEMDNFLLRIGRPRRAPVRGEQSMEAAAVRDFGGRLFDAVFRDELRVALATSLDRAESRDAGLRLRLRFSDAPELADLPWEYLYDRGARRFLALSEWTPVVRYLEFPGQVRPLAVQPPLRVLVLIASFGHDVARAASGSRAKPTSSPPDQPADQPRSHRALADGPHGHGGGESGDLEPRGTGRRPKLARYVGLEVLPKCRTIAVRADHTTQLPPSVKTPQPLTAQVETGSPGNRLIQCDQNAAGLRPLDARSEANRHRACTRVADRAARAAPLR